MTSAVVFISLLSSRCRKPSHDSARERVHSFRDTSDRLIPSSDQVVRARPFLFFSFFWHFFISPFFLPHLLRSLKSFALAASK